ncbi:amidohydrolase family protein [Alcaligenes phenolicus]|uniref:amidohydrolase family protein n=1 Tax=Alcaligenes TaxID=507 RepID=UPI0020308108|nr:MULTISPECIES: amidohydrolase family protein [Alcaligenes]URW84539.1 amidohydrolase family protein [Alcaligenes sp. DN25]WEA69379.1 amidohydrolase family protein [Alcaligenes faecalis]
MNHASLFQSHDLAQARILEPEHLLLPQGPVSGHAVLIEEGRFSDIGTVEEIAARHPGLPRLSLPGHLLMPGFVDAHHHVTQSYGKSLVYGEPSEIFRRVWVPLESTLNARHLYASSKLSALEALRGGFTTVCDAGTRSSEDLDAIVQATTDVGIRCVLGLICNDKHSAVLLDAEPIVARAQAHLQQWEHHALISPSLAISIPEAASDAMLHRIYSMSEEAGRVFQTHANEHLVAVERSLNAHGRRPIEHLAHIGALGSASLLAHATLVTPSEIRLMADLNAAVSYNPVASAWKGNAVAPAEAMRVQGIRLGMGTDGTRSDAFRMMDYGEAAQRFAFGMMVGDSSCGAGWTWLDMATRGGAEVIGLGAQTGQIRVGAQADFLVVDLQVPEMTPSWDLPWELVRIAARDQIRAVVVQGKLRLWEGQPVDWDPLPLLEEVRELARHAVAQSDIRKLHAPSTEHLARHAEQEKALA